MHESKKSKKEKSLMVAIPESGPSVEVNIFNDDKKREGKYGGGSLMARENYDMGKKKFYPSWSWKRFWSRLPCGLLFRDRKSVV